MSDVVFGFVNLNRNANQSGKFNVNISSGGSNLFGIKPGRTYNVKNIAAYTGADAGRREDWLWGAGLAGSDILAHGIYVGLNKVPISPSAWTNAPYEPQFLKLYDVTPPPVPSAPATPLAYAVGTHVTFSWPAVSDSEGGIAGYHLLIGTTPGGSNVFNAVIVGTAQIAAGTFGQTLYAKVAAINSAGIQGPFSGDSEGTLLLDPLADSDHDGMNNSSEALAGTSPLDPGSVFRILSLTGGNLLSWSSVSGKVYQVTATADLSSPLAPISGLITASNPVASFPDPAPQGGRKFYRVNLVP